MSGVIFLIVLIVFVMFVFGLFSIAEGQGGRRFVRSSPARRVVWHNPEANRAAVTAMRRAAYDASPDYVQVTDIGLLAYRTSTEPKLVRYGDVLADTHYLRPFAELWLPHRSRGAVRFELLDSLGNLRFADENRYELQRGKNTLLPRTWLPLREKAIHPGTWQFRLLAGDTVLAEHTFGWREVGGGVIQQYVDSDGEISPELQALLDVKPQDAVSLADLLSDQEDWA
jgi:hypothetical protein